MSPNPAKNTFSTNHVQSLEAMVKAGQKELEKYRDAQIAKDLNEKAKDLLRELEALKNLKGDEKRQLDGEPYQGTKAKVDGSAREVKSALVTFANLLKPEHCAGLEALVKQVTDLLARNKEAAGSDGGKKILEAADVLTKRVNNLKLKVGKALITEKDYGEIKTAAGKLIAETKVMLEKLAKAPKTVYKFNGSKTREDDLVKKIKQHLPSNGHNNISQALNDAVLGRGKSTGSLGCLHASSGVVPKGKNVKPGGCTLFFKRSGTEIDIIGIGQHENAGPSQTKYTIYFGLSGKKSVTL